MSALVSLQKLHFRYAGMPSDALAGLDFEVSEGELVGVVGPNGSGKSTLARLLGGLAKPAAGRAATVCGHDLLTDAGRLAARRDAGVLFQDPENQLVAQHVEEDVAFGLENLGWPAADIGARVDEMLAALDLEMLRRREPHLLSGGQQQRVALAGVLAIPRSLLVLDEPTAMLDAQGRAEVLDAIARVREDGLSVVLVTQEMDELRLAERVVALEGGAVVFDGPPVELFRRLELVRRLRLGLPQAAALGVALVERGRAMRHLPLDGEELAVELEARGAGAGEQLWLPVAEEPPEAESLPSDGSSGDQSASSAGTSPGAVAGSPHEDGLSVRCRELTFSYEEGRDPVPALSGVSFDLEPGCATALLGPSGAGKSTLLGLLKGLDEPGEGKVWLDGRGPEDRSTVDLRRRIGLVFQRPELQLFASTARDDVAFGPRQLGWDASVVAEAADLALELVDLPSAQFGERHPYSLSGGEQRRLALAGVLAMRPRLLLLDEPFVSLDPAARRDLTAVLRRLVAAGTTLVLATHDVDAAWSLCDRLLVLDAGRLVASGVWLPGSLDGLVVPQPFLIELWRRLGRVAAEAPHTLLEAAEALA